MKVGFIFIILFVSFIKGMEQNTPSIGQNLLTGVCAAASEIAINQPTIYIKNAAQRGAGMPNFSKGIAPMVKQLYTGAAVNFACLAPATAIQIAANGILERYHSAPSAQISFADKLKDALIAGSLSGIVSAPSETIVLQQQIRKLGAMKVVRQLAAESGPRFIFRGMIPTSLRDAGFCAGYLTLSPAFKQYTSSILSNPIVEVGSGLCAGMVVAICTHPFDTIKTQMQLSPELRTSMIKTAKDIITNQGYSGLLAGFKPRALRVMSAIYLMDTVKSKMTDYFTHQ